MSGNIARAALAAALVAAVQAPAVAADGVATLSVGAEYSTGKYGSDQATDMWYLPVTGKYETGPWAFRLVVPYVHVTGPGNVIGAGGDRIVVPGAAAERRTESGLGDITASAFRNVMDERKSALGLDLGAKVKLGTADETKGLGTGENDYSFQADLFKPLGSTTLFGSLGYRWYGDPPGVDLKNVFYGSVGASYRFSAQTTGGLAYDYRPKISPNGFPIKEATAYVSQRLSRDWRLQFYAVTGFSDGSPDLALGAVASLAF